MTLNKSPDKKLEKKQLHNPRISVIVPIYNTESFLKGCLDSITSQTYKNLEIICVNDGSTDNSADILKSYTEKDSRIKIITKKNQGLSAARNAALKIATGRYITFVDSDDKIAPNMVEDLIRALQKSKADIAICSFKEIYPNGKTVGFSRNYPTKTYSTVNAIAAMLQEKGFMLSTTMKLFPIKYFKDITFPINKLHEDIGTTYKLIMKAKKIAFIPNEYYLYLHHKNSIINQTFDERKFDLITLTDKMCEDIEKEFPNLKNITNKRRMRARFSILRQIPISHPETKQLLKYIKSHEDYILKNPTATKIDKIILKLTLFSPKILQFAYKLFK